MGPNLDEALQVVALLRAVRLCTGTEDPLLPLSENLHKLLSKLERIQHTANRFLFHSAPLLSLYEELLTILLLLARPIHFVIPRSWAILHLRKFAGIARYTSERETLWYQSIFIRVIVGFCSFICRLESSSPHKAAPDSLVRRAANILFVSTINMGTLEPLPADYDRMWNHIQKVLRLRGFPTNRMLEEPADQLLQKSKEAFTDCEGRDHLQVILTDGHPAPSSFAGLPVHDSSIASPRIPKQRQHSLKRVDIEDDDLSKARINAAYTHFLSVLAYRTTLQPARLAQGNFRRDRGSAQRR